MSESNPPQTQAEPNSAISTPSEFWAVFLLGLFLGVFGAHRFYARKFKSAVVQLLTFGGLGIWSFIDVILILLSKFKNDTGVVFENPKPKVSWGIFAAVIILGFASAASKNQNASSPSHHMVSSSLPVMQLAGSYQSSNPDWTLQLHTDGTFDMQAIDTGNKWHGTWSTTGSNGELDPTTAAALSFTVEGDGAIVINKYGYTFVR